jgi:molybdopterin/thiamine biosynthesis adenylyltransferase/rhodanese-related sulfurtransferase
VSLGGYVREVDIDEAAAARAAGAVLVDVREPNEWNQGIIPGAILVRLGDLPNHARESIPAGVPVVAYCRSGSRSQTAAAILARLGFTDVVSMRGGILAWYRAGQPVALPGEDEPEPEAGAAATGPGGLTQAQQARYSRHLLMPEVGPEGQRRLLDAKVLLVGAGGLGSPAALYLAAAGVGTIGIADFDVVDVSNLQRQVVHTTARVGTPKTASAAAAIAALDPAIRVLEHRGAIDALNAAGLISGFDVVIDGTDSFEARYAINDAAVRAGIPVVHASVYRFEGQATTFLPGAGPCYRCLFPAPPPPELAPACSVVGVLGVVPGIMGTIQATEALKLLLRVGRPLVGRLLAVDALELTFDEFGVERDPACPACRGVAPRTAPWWDA